MMASLLCIYSLCRTSNQHTQPEPVTQHSWSIVELLVVKGRWSSLSTKQDLAIYNIRPILVNRNNYPTCVIDAETCEAWRTVTALTATVDCLAQHAQCSTVAPQ